jgi:hypothetical protein
MGENIARRILGEDVTQIEVYIERITRHSIVGTRKPLQYVLEHQSSDEDLFATLESRAEGTDLR